MPSFQKTMKYDPTGKRSIMITIDRYEDPHLVSKDMISQTDVSLYGGKGLTWGYTLADEPLQWLKDNCTHKYQIRSMGRARTLHVWFEDDIDATLFRTFFG